MFETFSRHRDTKRTIISQPYKLPIFFPQHTVTPSTPTFKITGNFVLNEKSEVKFVSHGIEIFFKKVQSLGFCSVFVIDRTREPKLDTWFWCFPAPSCVLFPVEVLDISAATKKRVSSRDEKNLIVSDGDWGLSSALFCSTSTL